MHSNKATPYENLDPALILDAIESLGFICSGSLHTLNSYENRVYQVGVEDASPLIAKFYRPYRWTNDAILEEHQFAQELLDLEIPVVAPLKTAHGKTLHEHQGYRFALFPRWGGRAFEGENLEQLEWMGRFIGRLHAVGACHPFQHRMHLNVETYGYNTFQFLIENNFIPDHLKTNYCRIVEDLLKKIEVCFTRIGKVNYIRLHGDMHAGNILWNEGGPHIVDLDDCVMGLAIQDIWMLLSGDEAHMHLQLEHILRGYREFHDFNGREIYLIEALRTLRMLHYSAWIARRWEDPAFPHHFPWFNTPHYWQEQISHLNEQAFLLGSSQ